MDSTWVGISLFLYKHRWILCWYQRDWFACSHTPTLYPDNQANNSVEIKQKTSSMAIVAIGNYQHRGVQYRNWMPICIISLADVWVWGGGSGNDTMVTNDVICSVANSSL